MADILVQASDGFLLQAHVFKPEGKAKGAILVCPGLGIPKEFYYGYCNFLKSNDYQSLVFDYRGIGKSHDNSSSQEVNLKNWGIEDIPAMLNWIKNESPELKINFLGHSIAGQVAGLVRNHDLVDRFFFISSTGGFWQEFNFPLNLYTYFLFYIQIPNMVRLFGYMPRSLTYRGVSISKGVALEWAEWSRKRDYLRAYLSDQKIDHHYNDIHQRIDWIWFDDDPIATDKALESMMSYYPNAQIIKHCLRPKELRVGRIGHSGFFTKKAREEYWKYPLNLIESKNSSS